MKRSRGKGFKNLLRLVVLLGLPLCLFLIWRLEPLLVRNIVVTTDYDVNANQKIVKILEKTKGQNILSLNTEKLASEIKSSDLKIKEVKVQKQFPGQLSLTIVKRQAVAILPLGTDFFLVDKEGLVLDQNNEAHDLPLVNLNLGLQNLKVGSSIDNKKQTVFFILDSLNGKTKVASANEVDDNLEIKLAEGPVVIFPFEEKNEEKLASLQLLLTRFRIEGRQPAKIDMRFDKPVVTF